MTRTPWYLVWKYLKSHWVRTGLTVSAIAISVLLFCTLISVIASVNSAVDQAASDRVMTQSAVSLFVNLPLDYQPKIEGVDGADEVSKMQWFGAHYQNPKNFFAQFAVDHDRFFDMYAEDFEIIEGPNGSMADGVTTVREDVLQAMAADRRACIVGEALATDPKFGFEVGKTIQLKTSIFRKSDDSEGWDFNVVGVFRPKRTNVDDRTLYFRFDYLRETMRGAGRDDIGTGVYVINLDSTEDPGNVVSNVDGLFVNGPQRSLTQTEAAFQAGFASMLGNLPLFLGSIGGAVVFAVFFSVVNTMVMSARQRTRDVGVMKALGFSDQTMAILMLVESLALSAMGGLFGVVGAVGLAAGIRNSLGSFIPNYHIQLQTILIGLGIAMGMGLIAAIAPSLRVVRLNPVSALRSEG